MSAAFSSAKLIKYPGLLLAISTSLHTWAETKEAGKLEYIEVLAQKRPQSIQAIPVAVTALNGNEFNSLGIADVYDLQGYAPAFSAFQSQSATNTSFSIRGIATSSQNFGFESSVGLYVDGVYRSRQNAVVNDLVDIDLVTILRGPQGTLFGKNTPAGAVSFRTRAPSFTNGDGFISATAGNDNLFKVSGASSFVAVEDEFAFRVSGFKTKRDGWVDDVHLGPDLLNNRDRSGVRLQALYLPTNAVSVRIIADYTQLDERCCATLTWQDNRQAEYVPGKVGTDTLLMSPLFNATLFTRSDYFDYATALNDAPHSVMRDKGLSAEFTWEYSAPLTFHALTAWRSIDSVDETDTDFTNVDLLSTSNDAEQQAFSQELRFTYSTPTTTTVAGIYYFSQNLNLDFAITIGDQYVDFFSQSASALSPLLDGINGLSEATSGLIAPVANPTPANTDFAHTAYQEQNSTALFAQTDWQFKPEWTVTAGLRYTRERKTLSGEYTETGPGINGLQTEKNRWPNPVEATGALINTATLLATNQVPNLSDLGSLAPFQQPGWGFYFLNTASILPRSPVDETRTDNQITGTTKLSWQPASDSLYYLSAATGFKSGGMNTDRIAEGLALQFAPEKSMAFEIGVKKDIEPLNLRINAAIHSTKIMDFQASTFTGLGFNLQNAGDIDAKGFEVEMTWFANSDLEVKVNVARTLAKFARFEKGTCWATYTWHTDSDDPGRQSPELPYCSRTGDRLGFEPETSVTLMLAQTLMLGQYPLIIGADYQYFSDYLLDHNNDPYKHMSDYALVNARVQLVVSQWDADFTLWARNLLNEEYVARNGFDVPVQTGKLMAYPGQPISFGLTLQKHF